MHPPILPFIYPSIHPLIHSPLQQPPNLSILPPSKSSTHPSIPSTTYNLICPITHTYTHSAICPPSIYPSIHPASQPFVHLSIHHLSVHSSSDPSIYPTTPKFFHTFTYTFNSLTRHPYAHPSTIHIFFYLLNTHSSI